MRAIYIGIQSGFTVGKEYDVYHIIDDKDDDADSYLSTFQSKNLYFVANDSSQYVYASKLSFKLIEDLRDEKIENILS